MEKICGPILPMCGIGNTFRSEVGIGYKFASICAAQLTTAGSAATVDFDLRGNAVLDKNPPYVEVYANLRLGRLGLRPSYFLFDNKSVNSRFGKLEWSGFRLGADLDALYHKWLTFGASIDAYFIDPRFNGRFFRTGNFEPPPPDDNTEQIDIVGARPYTWGLYLGYMPPVILGMPVHFNAFCRAPLGGSKLFWYGAGLSFRPQMYSNLACKLGYEQAHLTLAPSSHTADLKMEWQLLKVEFAAYF